MLISADATALLVDTEDGMAGYTISGTAGHRHRRPPPRRSRAADSGFGTARTRKRPSGC